MVIGFTAEVVIMSTVLGIGMAETESEYMYPQVIALKLTSLYRYKRAAARHHNLCRHESTPCTCVCMAARYYFRSISVRACSQGWFQARGVRLQRLPHGEKRSR
jgi:hypothetical protein